MKKLTAILLAATLLVSLLAGCGKKETDTNSSDNKITWQTASGDSVFVGNTPSGSKDDSSAPNGNSTTNQNSNSQNGSASNGGLGDITVSSSTSNTKPNSSSGNNTQSNSSDEDETYKDISGSGITQDGVETILTTTPITDEFTTPSFTKLTYQHSNGKKMCYSLRLPLDYNENEKYPVILFLHGIKQSGSDWNTLVHLPSLYQYNADIVNRAIVVSPQAVDTDLWNMAKGGNGDTAYALLQKIEKEYAVDKNRIYIVGLSMGGIGTWGMIEEYPDHFAAASPICGMGNPAKAKTLVNIPIWAWHGTADTTVNYNWDGATPKMYDAIKAAGGNKMIFTKLQNEGHNAWDPAFSSREHLSWLFSQIKGKHQSTEYSLVPYLTVKDSNGNVVISEKDAISIDTRKGTGKGAGKRDLVLTLSKSATQKLSSAYQKSGGKEFKIYFGNKEIVTFKATKKTEGRILVIRDVFTESGYNKYYTKLLTTVGKN